MRCRADSITNNKHHHNAGVARLSVCSEEYHCTSEKTSLGTAQHDIIALFFWNVTTRTDHDAHAGWSIVCNCAASLKVSSTIRRIASARHRQSKTRANSERWCLPKNLAAPQLCEEQIELVNIFPLGPFSRVNNCIHGPQDDSPLWWINSRSFFTCHLLSSFLIFARDFWIMKFLYRMSFNFNKTDDIRLVRIPCKPTAKVFSSRISSFRLSYISKGQHTSCSTNFFSDWWAVIGRLGGVTHKNDSNKASDDEASPLC